MKIAVVITTYNNPAWLEKVFWGYAKQTDPNFKLIIADDGSLPATKQLIDHYKQHSVLEIEHVWHEDKGFQKTKILNDVLRTTDCEYLIFTDHDCIARQDFVAVHRKFARKGQFLSGGYFKLTMPVSKSITQSDVQQGRVFDYHWLRSMGQSASFKSLKLTAGRTSSQIYELLSPTKATWNGMNSSAFTEDINAVNGFNEHMQYGGLDREMGERMLNNGIKGKKIRYQAICVHLDHKRGYATEETWRKNKAIREQVRVNKLTWTDYGIVKQAEKNKQ